MSTNFLDKVSFPAHQLQSFSLKGSHHRLEVGHKFSLKEKQDHMNMFMQISLLDVLATYRSLVAAHTKIEGAFE